MGLILSPEPSIVTGSTLTVNITKQNDVEAFAVTTNGIPPVIAKYIAYDNLSPANPFIATVEDGLGNILLDGGFPKWYNDNCNSGWTTYAQLSPSYKYLYDAIDFISNKTKVLSGNKKILIIGDTETTSNYSIKDANLGRGGFKLSIDKICSIKGYIPTYKTPQDYGGILDSTYIELDQYCCVLFFSTTWTNLKLISDNCIQSLISYRENGNGIFIITDHGDRDLNNITEAVNLDYSAFYRTANFLVTNFGCYFSGNYNRNPVNVGFLRANYGNHILWNNLLDSDSISAGGSESKVVITEYPLYTGNHTITITSDGYHSIKTLIKLTNGELKIATYTYGKNVPEIIYFLKEDGTNYTSSEKKTFLKTHSANIKIDYSSDVSGLLKKDLVPIGTFNFLKASNKINKTFYTGYKNDIKIEDDHIFYVQITNPLNYTKGLRIKFDKPTFSLRTSKVLNHINNNEFKLSNTSSNFRNFNKLLCSPNNIMKHFENRFRYHRIYDYFLNIDNSAAIANTTGHYTLRIPSVTDDFRCITFYNNIYYIGTDEGVFTTEDLENFAKIPETNDHTPNIKGYKNYLSFSQLSSKIVISFNGGKTFETISLGSVNNCYAQLFTTEDNLDYLYVGTQGGYIVKINLQTKTVVYTKKVGGSYIDDLKVWGNKIIFSGHDIVGTLTYDGIWISTTLNEIINLSFRRASFIAIRNGKIYFSVNHQCILETEDMVNFNIINFSENYLKSNNFFLYNKTKDEFFINFGNTVEFLRTPSPNFNELVRADTIITFKSLGDSKVVDVLWEETYGRYIVLTQGGLFINYKV